MIKYAGIDYSLTTPCLCVTSDGDFNSSEVFFLTNNKKYTGKHNNIYGELHSPYTSEQERYKNIASFFLDKLSTNMKIAIEDYSFGSTGRVFHIAENCGLLKYLLWESNMNFQTFAPTTIKKFATGKGNANKESMYDSFKLLTEVDLMTFFSTNNRLSNPVTDIVDSFFLSFYIQSLYNIDIV